MPARDRIREVVEKWFLVEPLLFAVWTTHEVVANPRIRGIRVHQGRIEFNPGFIDGLDRNELKQVLAMEAMRILLKHPYSRRPGHAELAYAASNLTLQEYLETNLPLPRARDVFGCSDFDRQYYEFYYQKLLGQWVPGSGLSAMVGDEGGTGQGDESSTLAASAESQATHVRDAGADDSNAEASDPLDAYADPSKSGGENTEGWGPDELRLDQINDKIRTAAETNSWGSIPGRFKELILASLRPRLSYRAVLREFRASVLSIHRRLTRMKPNRRYGFDYLGSKYEFTTHLLFAIDVSGSMTSDDIARALAVVNQFFAYGVRTIDVIQFDTEIQGPILTLRRAKREIKVIGRGGTSFEPVFAFVDTHPEYDGMIIFTDGQAAVPRRPKNRRTRVLWLFNYERTYQHQYKALAKIGRAAYLKEASATGKEGMVR